MCHTTIEILSYRLHKLLANIKKVELNGSNDAASAKQEIKQARRLVAGHCVTVAR